jgi:hypothetical protein
VHWLDATLRVSSAPYNSDVPDLKPPRLATDERSTLLALLQYQRESLVRKASGVDPVAATSSPVPSGTSLVWLVEHLAAAESVWIEQRFAGLAVEAPLDGPLHVRALDRAIERYRATWTRVDAVIAGAELDDRCSADDVVPPVNLRWVLAHLLEETARHAGHADILRELVDGETGR